MENEDIECVEVSTLMTPQELADWLRVSSRWVEKQVQIKSLPGAVKVGRYWRFDRRTLERHISRGALLFQDDKRRHKSHRGGLHLKGLPRPSN